MPIPLARGSVRLAIVASSLDDLKAKITVVREAIAAGRTRLDPASIYLESGAAAPAPIAFLFPGRVLKRPT